jgi:hypothetical protein
MLRWLATLVIAALLVLDLLLPWTGIGRRGHSAEVRADAPGAVVRVGEPFPDVALADLSGAPVRIEDFRGHRVLLTFERSLDW